MQHQESDCADGQNGMEELRRIAREGAQDAAELPNPYTSGLVKLTAYVPAHLHAEMVAEHMKPQLDECAHCKPDMSDLVVSLIAEGLHARKVDEVREHSGAKLAEAKAAVCFDLAGKISRLATAINGAEAVRS
jgi:hypothetical protein